MPVWLGLTIVLVLALGMAAGITYMIVRSRRQQPPDADPLYWRERGGGCGGPGVVD